MDVRALRGIGTVRGWPLDDPHFKADGQSLWREALCVVARLVAQHSAHEIFPGRDGTERMHRHVHGEIAAVDIQFFIGREGEDQILAWRVFDLTQNNVGGQVHLECGGNEEF